MPETWWKSATAVLIVAGAVLYSFWDVLAVSLGGPNGASTESTTIGTWLDESVWLTGALAVLIGHFYASGSTSITWRHFLVAALCAIAGYIATRLS